MRLGHAPRSSSLASARMMKGKRTSGSASGRASIIACLMRSHCGLSSSGMRWDELF